MEYVSDFEGGRVRLYLVGDLVHLGLEFYYNIKIPIYQVVFTIKFIRSNDGDALYR